MDRKVKTLPKNLNVSIFMNRVRQIETSLSGPLFLTVLPLPSEVLLKVDELQNLQAEVFKKNYQHLANRNAVRKTIEEMLSKQVSYVNAISQGDLAILEESGFDLNKIRQPRTVPTQGKTPTASNTAGGTVTITCTGIHNQDFVELEIDAPDGQCLHYSGLYAKFKVSNLPKGVILKARMRGVNCHGDGEWTDTLSFISYASAQHGDAI
jgi:hypothetical protein